MNPLSSNITLQSITNQYLMFYCISVDSNEAADQTKRAGLLQDHSTHNQECTHGRRPWWLLIQTGSWRLIHFPLDTLTSLLPFDWYFLCSAVWPIRFLPEWVVCQLWNLWRLFTSLDFFPPSFSSCSENMRAGCSRTGITSASFPQQFAVCQETTQPTEAHHSLVGTALNSCRRIRTNKSHLTVS